jgi:hypothetical protein
MRKGRSTIRTTSPPTARGGVGEGGGTPGSIHNWFQSSGRSPCEAPPSALACYRGRAIRFQACKEKGREVMILVVQQLRASEMKRPFGDQRPQRAVGFARHELFSRHRYPPQGHSPVFPAHQGKTLPPIGGRSQGGKRLGGAAKEAPGAERGEGNREPQRSAISPEETALTPHTRPSLSLRTLP